MIEAVMKPEWHQVNTLTEPQPLVALRATAWSGAPSSPGVYWWYFPHSALDQLHITELSDVSKLRLRYAPDGKVCLYHGMAKNLSERVKWHAAQKLTSSSLQSGFLSTFRLTLLALNDFDYLRGGGEQIDGFFDSLSVAWRQATTHEEAKQMERYELQGEYHYPLNIQGNRRPELQTFVQHLKSSRKDYKRRFVMATARSAQPQR